MSQGEPLRRPSAWLWVIFVALLVAACGGEAPPSVPPGETGRPAPTTADPSPAIPGETGAPEPPPLSPTPGQEMAVLVGAGRVGRCNRAAELTASLAEQIEGIVLILGDNAYEEGTLDEYARCYEPNWGRLKDRTRPIPGNHEYRSAGAAGYFEYFGEQAGTPGEGWYAFEAGGWRVYALNSACRQIGGCDPGSAQYDWLAQELQANASRCSMAYWHVPIWASAYYDGSSGMRPIFELLYEAGAELVLTGHDHGYERFMPINPAGEPDPDQGIRQINVGTGSSSLPREFLNPPLPITEVRDRTSHGVIRLELWDGGYSWEFIPVRADGFRDSGSDDCAQR